MVIKFSKHKHGNQLLEILLNEKDFVSIQYLIQKLKISRRSVFYLTKNVNNELAEKNYLEINNIKDTGYYLPNETKELLENYDFSDNNNFLADLNIHDRRNLLVLELIDSNHLSLNEMVNIFGVSKNTILRDLQNTRLELKKYNINIKNTQLGKIITGKEIDIRSWVYKNIFDLYNFLKFDINSKNKKKISDKLFLLEQITGNYFTDNARISLIYFINWYLKRIFKGHYLNNSKNLDNNPTSLEKTWAMSFLNEIGIFNNSESEFLTKIVKSAPFHQINLSNPLVNKLYPIAKQIINKFSDLSKINIYSKKLINDLTIHLTSTYYRILYGFVYNQPGLTNIKNEYSQIFELTQIAIQPFIKFIGKPISMDEISLISLYLGGGLRANKLFQKKRTQKKKAVLIVCSSGIGTSRILFNILSEKYPNVYFKTPISNTQYEEITLKNIALIISTININAREGIPIVQVAAFPSSYDLNLIDSMLIKTNLKDSKKIDPKRYDIEALLDIISKHARILEPKELKTELRKYLLTTASTSNTQKKINNNIKYPLKDAYHLMNLLTSSHIQFKNYISNWESAIYYSLKPLVLDHSVEKSYPIAIINLLKELGPYMVIGDNILLAHAKKTNGVNKLSFSLLLLKKPIFLPNSKKPIKLIIGLAPIDNEKHLPALAELMKLIQDKNWLNNLFKCENTQQLLKFLNKV